MDLLLALEKGGADVIELGVPFTDPMADGATIQVATKSPCSRVWAHPMPGLREEGPRAASRP